MSEDPQLRPSLQVLQEILEEKIAAAQASRFGTLLKASSSLSTTASLQQLGIGSPSANSSSYNSYSDISYSDSDEEQPPASVQKASRKKTANTASSSAQTLFRTKRSIDLAAMANSSTKPLMQRTQRSCNLAAMANSPTNQALTRTERSSDLAAMAGLVSPPRG